MVKRLPTLHGFSKDGKSNGPSGNELGRAVNQLERIPTPNTMDHIEREGMRPSRAATNRKTGYLSEYLAVKRMPSIRASDADKGGRGDLIQAVRGNENSHFKKRLPTVRTQSKSGGGSGLDGGSGAREMLSDEELMQFIGGSLNPPWVEWLQGFPIGFTELRPLEMLRFQQWFASHGRF